MGSVNDRIAGIFNASVPTQPVGTDHVNGTTYGVAHRPEPDELDRLLHATGEYPTVAPAGPATAIAARSALDLAPRVAGALDDIRVRDRARQMFAEEQAEAARQAAAGADRMIDGADFLFDVPDLPPLVWGVGKTGLWTVGEALMIVGPQGVGKTGLSGQLVRALLGLMPQVLGMDVAPAEGSVVYWAMDRPQQAQRSLARMFAPGEREQVRGRLKFWPGPPPGDWATAPEAILDVAERHKASVMVVDSLKDAALGLSSDETGAGYNRARQALLREGVQLLELHHMRKRESGATAPQAIGDVYGSGFLTAGAGSVLLLWGNPGDPVVRLSQIKSPLAEMPPMLIMHDAVTGLSSVQSDPETDVVLSARHSGGAGITANEAAATMYATLKPSRSEVEKARRELERKAELGLLIRIKADEATGRGHATRYATPAGPSSPDPRAHRGGEGVG